MILLDASDVSLKTSMDAAISQMTTANTGLSVSPPQYVLVDNQLQDDQRKQFGECPVTLASLSGSK